jgi:prepilin-type N-terminal cleavage/methylation domain-containing protein
MKTGQNSSVTRTRSVPVRGFSLLEVMVASAIFFMVAFAILEMVTRALVGVRALQQREPDPGIILAMYSTNKAWEPMHLTGNYEDIAPGMYPGYSWELFAEPYMETNVNLYVVRIISYGQAKSGRGPSTAETMFFSPLSKPVTGLGGLR